MERRSLVSASLHEYVLCACTYMTIVELVQYVLRESHDAGRRSVFPRPETMLLQRFFAAVMASVVVVARVEGNGIPARLG